MIYRVTRFHNSQGPKSRLPRPALGKNEIVIPDRYAQGFIKNSDIPRVFHPNVSQGLYLEALLRKHRLSISKKNQVQMALVVQLRQLVSTSWEGVHQRQSLGHHRRLQKIQKD